MVFFFPKRVFSSYHRMSKVDPQRSNVLSPMFVVFCHELTLLKLGVQYFLYYLYSGQPLTIDPLPKIEDNCWY